MSVTHVLANKSAVVPVPHSPGGSKSDAPAEERLLEVGDCRFMVTNTTVSEPPIRAVAVVYLITLIHHIYGGLVFGSVERLLLALVVTILFVATAWLSRLTTANLWARRAYWSLVAGFWIVLIGLYEGGFNHLLYLVLRSTAIISEETLERLYPAASDAMVSNDVFFQATGVLTVVASAALAFTVVAKGKRARTGQVGSA